METKRCSGCGETKPLTEFYRHKRHRDGYGARCKQCRSAEMKVYYVRHAEALRAKTKAWQQANPERYREQLRAWKAKPGNAEHKRAMDRAYKRAHQEDQKRYARLPNRRVAARLNAKTQKAKRKAQIGATVHPITAAEWTELKEKYHGCCAYCGREEPNPTMDHVVPLIHGGDHTVANIVPACGPCNREKSDRSVVEFLRTRRSET